MGKRLERVIDLKPEYIRLTHRVEELESLAEKVTKSFSLAPSRGSNVKQDDTYVKLIEYKDKQKDKIKEYLKECEKLEEEIDKLLEDPVTRAIMKARYLDGEKVEAIAAAQNYDARTVYRILKKGRVIYEQTYERV